MKICSKCGDEKSTEDFYKDKRQSDGLRAHCKVCHNEDCRKWQTTNRDFDLENKRKYMKRRREDPVVKAAEKVAYREWRQSTPERESLRGARRRARKMNAPQGDPTLLIEWAEILKNDSCAYCGELMEELDHIQALNDNGSHEWANLTSSCRKCNASKRDTPLLLWML